jgi:hypothetical protein
VVPEGCFLTFELAGNRSHDLAAVVKIVQILDLFGRGLQIGIDRK